MSLDWNATINTIRESLPPTQFQNWFKPLTLIRCDEKSVVVGVPSRFHEEWLKSNYSNHLSAAIQKHSGTPLQLEFEVKVGEENLEAALSEAPAPVAPAKPILRLVDNTKPATEPEPDDALPLGPLLPTFAQPFIELEYNRVAYQCSLLASQPSFRMNTLVILGGVGMGKTQLLTEIGNQVLKWMRPSRVKFVSAEPFTAEMVAAIKSDTMLQFKNKYRYETDCLLFDDLQALSRKMKTQEELVYIFNEITARGGRVIFSTSVTPQRLEDFIEPLRSRLSAGLLAEIKTPMYEEKVELLARIGALHDIHVDQQGLRSIADWGQKDVRELIGNLLRVHLQAGISNCKIDTEFLTQEGRHVPPTKQAVTMEEIITLVEYNFGVSRMDLASKSRKTNMTWARQVAMFLARQHTLMPLEEIGKTFGRDHATVIHAFQKVKETMETQPTRKYEVEFLNQKLGAKAPLKRD